MKILVLAIIVWLYCIICNFYWFIKSKIMYKRFLSDKEITSYIPEIDRLFKTAGTSYTTYYDECKDGYNQRMCKNVSYLCDKKKYFYEVNKVFLLTIGTFREKLKRSILPIHIAFLPSYLIGKTEIRIPLIIKLPINLMYWAASIIAGYHIEVLLDRFYIDYLQSILDKIV